MSVRWLSPANEDVSRIINWYAQNSPDDLQIIAKGIWDTAQSLSRLPNRGRRGELEGTREILVPRLPYMLVYKVLDKNVAILRVLHQHQNWP